MGRGRSVVKQQRDPRADATLRTRGEERSLDPSSTPISRCLEAGLCAVQDFPLTTTMVTRRQAKESLSCSFSSVPRKEKTTDEEGGNGVLTLRIERYRAHPSSGVDEGSVGTGAAACGKCVQYLGPAARTSGVTSLEYLEKAAVNISEREI